MVQTIGHPVDMENMWEYLMFHKNIPEHQQYMNMFIPRNKVR